mmetsp:Transcript_15332/g.29139  ORF Transcript_15332/g.29139 Transcript_15332/m.29139 type:complete len:233 (-) Transcript_15332:626-1324(-)
MCRCHVAAPCCCCSAMQANNYALHGVFSQLLQPLLRCFQLSVRLAKRETDKVCGQALVFLGVEGRHGDSHNPEHLRKEQAKRPVVRNALHRVVLLGQPNLGDVGDREKRPFGYRGLQPRLLEALGEVVPFRLVCLRQVVVITRAAFVRLQRDLQRPSDCLLHGRGDTKGDELVDALHAAHEIGGPHAPADFPPRHRERFSRGAHHERALPHPFERGDAKMRFGVVSYELVDR